MRPAPVVVVDVELRATDLVIAIVPVRIVVDGAVASGVRARAIRPVPERVLVSVVGRATAVRPV